VDPFTHSTRHFYSLIAVYPAHSFVFVPPNHLLGEQVMVNGSTLLTLDDNAFRGPQNDNHIGQLFKQETDNLTNELSLFFSP
jgi:hypothetical protein